MVCVTFGDVKVRYWIKTEEPSSQQERALGDKYGACDGKYIAPFPPTALFNIGALTKLFLFLEICPARLN